MYGLLVLLAIFARADGSTVGDPHWPDGMAPRHTQERYHLLVPPAPYAHAEDSTVDDHLQHDGTVLYRS